MLTLANVNYQTCRCPKCPFNTPVKMNLPQHYDIVHRKIKDYVCHICGFATHAKPYLRNHEKAEHEGGRVLVCPHCPFKAICKSSLDEHISQLHAVVIEIDDAINGGSDVAEGDEVEEEEEDDEEENDDEVKSVSSEPECHFLVINSAKPEAEVLFT